MGRNDAVNARVRQYACREAAEAVQALSVPGRGLSEALVLESRQRYGENGFAHQEADTVLFRLRRAFVNPFTLILFVIAVISVVTEYLSGGSAPRGVGGTVPLILGMLLVSGVVRFGQELRAKETTDRLTRLFHENRMVRVRRDGSWCSLPAEDIVVGDLLRLAAGDRVPADLRLTRACDFFVSQSALTGESAVLEKKTARLNECKSRSFAAYENIAFFGSVVMGGSGEGVVLAVGKDTASGALLAAPAGQKTGFDKGANSIALVLIRFMAVLLPVVFIACWLTKGDAVAAFLFALSVAVGLTPELLPMVITACLSRGSAAMERKETIVKNINAMQGFGSMDVLCVDKTGTLTGDRLQLEYYMDILGNESREVLHCAYVNSAYHTGVQNHLDAAILDCRTMPEQGAALEALVNQYEKLDELPFDYERKFASVLVRDSAAPGCIGQSSAVQDSAAEGNTPQDNVSQGNAMEDTMPQGALLLVKGNVEAVLRRCRYVAYRGRQYEIDALQQEAETGGGAERFRRDSTAQIVEELTEDGMKVLAVACKPLLGRESCSKADEQALTLLGYVAFFDAPKQSAASALKKLRELHLSVKVLTGDEAGVTQSVCRRLGLDTETILTGTALNALSDDALLVQAERVHIFAELSPRQKARIVAALRENGHTVGFLGDGMNDLSAMAEADVGISVDNAVEAIGESADVILLKKDLGVLEQGILEGRKAFANMSKYIRITASSNFGNICSVVIASVLLPFLPMASVQLLLLNLLYDILCLALPWDAVDQELYDKPREWSGRTLGRFMWHFGPLSSLFDLLTFAFLFFVLCPAVCGAPFAALSGTAEAVRFMALFHTGWFLESMWTQVLILHLLRTERLPFVQSRPSAPVLAVTLCGIALFTLLTASPLGALLGLAVLPPWYFLFLFAVVFCYLLLVSAAKAQYVRRYRELI